MKKSVPSSLTGGVFDKFHLLVTSSATLLGMLASVAASSREGVSRKHS
jgi:hypothetical protein